MELKKCKESGELFSPVAGKNSSVEVASGDDFN